MAPKTNWDFRDVSIGLQILRDFLLGRKHKLHGRFPPTSSSRTIPQPFIPRGPEYRYSDQYYYNRSVVDSIKPPVVAPVAEGPPVDQNSLNKSQHGGLKPNSLHFTCLPTPGLPWWWDGHCYYTCVPDVPEECPPEQCPPSPQCRQSPPAS